MLRLFSLYALLCLGFLQPAGAQDASEEQPYLILISCDGYRWDYTQRYQPPNITRFIEEGVQAFSMIPSFPSKTFPNHYAIATGLTPEHNGLVNNSFYDPIKDEEYRIYKREVVEDGRWYSGTPLWVLAEQHGLKAASYFFVGSEADVQGVRPSYYYRYDGSVPNTDRVQQVLDWLQLPASKRPHMITLYFSDMDDVGHRQGPSNEEAIKEALFQLDEVLGQLFKGVSKSGLPVNIIMVSDHGMVDVAPDRLLNIDRFEQDEQFRIVNNGALAHVYLNAGTDSTATLQHLQSQAEDLPLSVYPIADFPYYHEKGNPRLGQFILYPDYPHYLSDSRRIAKVKSGAFSQGGEHGFNPEFPEMHAIFYANGPAFYSGLTIPSFRNVHVYPLACRILGLPVPEGIDGRLEVLEGTLRK